MSTRAYMSKNYRIRLGIISLMLLLFGVWCIYDGTVAYPAQKEKWDRYEEVRDGGDPQWRERWRAVSAEEGWAYEDQPKRRTDMDIMTQFIMAALLFPPGILLAGYYVVSSRKWVEADETGLRNNSGREVAWDNIKSVDLSRWKSKGIAVVQYNDASGKSMHITLDDWKFDRDKTNDIFSLLKNKTAFVPDEIDSEQTQKTEASESNA